MTGIITSLLPIALLMHSPQPADKSVEWLDDTRVKVSALTYLKGDSMMPDFGKGEKALKAMAKEACPSKDLGKPKIEGEVMVTAIGVSPEGKRHVTLSATYACT